MRGDRQLLWLIFVGGCVGTLARAGLIEAFPPSDSWPWATSLANVAGAFLLGVVITSFPRRTRPSHRVRGLLGTGLCGGLTTFSTLQIEVLELGRSGHGGLALAYLGTSIVTGILAVLLGRVLVQRIRVDR